MKILNKVIEVREVIENWLTMDYIEAKLLAVLFFFIPLIFSIYGHENFTTIKFSFLMGVVGVLLWLFAKRGKVELVKDKWFWGFLGIFLTGVVLSVVFAFQPLTAIFGFYRRFTNSLIFFGCWSAVLVVLLSRNVEFKGFEIIIKLSAVSSVFVAFFGVLQSFGVGYYQPWELGFSRVSSLLGNANFSAMYLAATLPFLVILFLEQKGIKRWVGFVAVLLCMYALVIFASRGAVLALVSAFLIMGFLAIFNWKKNWKLLASMGVVVIAVLGVSFLFFNSVRVGSLTSSDSNIASRVLVWNFAVERIRENPWVGVGLGNYANDYLMNRPNYLGVQDMDFDDPHNLFLHLWLEGGVLVIAGFMGLVLLAALRASREFLKTGNLYFLAGLGALVAWLMSASFNPVEPANWVFLAFLLALCLRPSLKDYKQVKFLFLARGVLVIVGLGLFIICLGFVISEPLLDFANGGRLFQNYEKSFKYSSWVVRLNPIREQGYIFQLGSAMKLDYPPEEVERLLGKYAKLRPNEFVTLGNLGVVNHYLYLKTGEAKYLDKAINYITVAETKNPLSIKPGQLLAYMYYEDGQVKKSKRQAIKNLVISQREKNNLDDYALLARLNFDENKLEQVIDYLESVYKIDVNNRGYLEIVKYLKKERDLTKISIPIVFSTGLFY